MARDPKNLCLDPTHCRAICDEIGERLRESLGREAAEMPPDVSSIGLANWILGRRPGSCP
jgi:hypothetical protein